MCKPLRTRSVVPFVSSTRWAHCSIFRVRTEALCGVPTEEVGWNPGPQVKVAHLGLRRKC